MTKKNYQAEEIGKLRAAVAHRDASVAHYRGLVEKHSKALHRQQKEIKRLRRELKVLEGAITQSPESMAVRASRL
jgi:peptidoglycan hydrolase CwlO-like protein